MSPVRMIVALFAFVAAIAAIGCSRDPDVEKREALSRGNAYVEEGRYQEAVIEYRRALQVDRNFAEARLRLADVYKQRGDISRAFLEITRAAELMPNNPDLQIEAGRWLLAAGRFEQARIRAELVLAKDPNHPRALVLRGNALARLKDLYAALEDMERAVAAAPDQGMPYASLAVVQSARGEQEAADEAFKKALELQPQDVVVRLAYVNFLLSVRRHADAERQLREAGALQPGNVLVARATVGYYVGIGAPEKAEPYLRHIAESSNDPAASFALARLYAGLRRPDDAVRILTKLAAATDTVAEAKLQLAAISYKRGQKAQAHALVQEVLSASAQRPSDRARAMLLRSGFLLDEGKTADAAAAAKEAVGDDPLLPQGFYLLGLAYTALGNFEEGRKAFNEELRIEPRDVRALLGLSNLELFSGNLDQAEKLADQAATVAPIAPAVRLALLRVALARGRLERASDEVKALRAARFDTAEFHLLEGQLRLTENSPDAARASFIKAAELAPQSVAPAAELIRLDLGQGRIRAARVRADSLATRSPDDADVLMLVGRTYATSNDFATAERYFRQAIAVDPSMTIAYGTLGSMYLQQRRVPDALKEFQALAAAYPKSLTAHTMVAALHEAQGRRGDAKAAYRKALQIDPTAVVASNNLAWMMVEDNENIDAALELAQVARGRLPRSPDIADTVGWIYYKKGLYPLAVTALSEAVQKQPKNAEFLYHLGLARARAGEDELARQHLEQALKINPKSINAAEAKSTLPRLRARRS